MNDLNPPDHRLEDDFEAWAAYFASNLARHDRLDDLIPWDQVPVSPLPPRQVAALARSLQRFELGESGEGDGLLSKARRRNDTNYTVALVRFVKEEQKHSALFAAALERFGTPRLTAHWSDAAFVVLRRLMGLRTEVTLFLIAETVAMEYFGALRRSSDPVIAGIARRVITDEVEHVRFQIDQLRVCFEKTPLVVRVIAAGAAWAVAAGAASIVAIDHGPAMKVCGLGRITFWRRALGHFARSVPAAFRLDRGSGAGAGVAAEAGGRHNRMFGPSVEATEFHSLASFEDVPRLRS